MPDSSIEPYSQEAYQKVYDQHPRYGCAATGSCPAVRLLPLYQDWLKPPVMDFGCGTGETVLALIEAAIEARGADWIAPKIERDEGLFVQCDITHPMNLDGITTGLCVDVFEHIPTEPLAGLLENLSRLPRQVICINNASSVNVIDGQSVELHVNRQSFDAWRDELSKWVKVCEEIRHHENQRIFLCEHLPS